MLKRFIPVLVLTAVCWLVFLVNNLIFKGHFDQYGITPRQVTQPARHNLCTFSACVVPSTWRPTRCLS